MKSKALARAKRFLMHFGAEPVAAFSVFLVLALLSYAVIVSNRSAAERVEGARAQAEANETILNRLNDVLCRQADDIAFLAGELEAHRRDARIEHALMAEELGTDFPDGRPIGKPAPADVGCEQRQWEEARK